MHCPSHGSSSSCSNVEGLLINMIVSRSSTVVTMLSLYHKPSFLTCHTSRVNVVLLKGKKSSFFT